MSGILLLWDRSNYVVQVGVKFIILLPQPLKHWDYRHQPPYSPASGNSSYQSKKVKELISFKGYRTSSIQTVAPRDHFQLKGSQLPGEIAWSMPERGNIQGGHAVSCHMRDKELSNTIKSSQNESQGQLETFLISSHLLEWLLSGRQHIASADGNVEERQPLHINGM